MNMLPQIMWELRPIDFYELYNAHKKRERQDIRKLSIQVASVGLAEHYTEEKLFKDLYYLLTETERPPEKTLSEKIGKEKLAEVQARHIKAAQMQLEKKNGKHKGNR